MNSPSHSYYLTNQIL